MVGIFSDPNIKEIHYGFNTEGVSGAAGLYNKDYYSNNDNIYVHQMKKGVTYKFVIYSNIISAVSNTSDVSFGIMLANHGHDCDEIYVEANCIREGYSYKQCKVKTCKARIDYERFPKNDNHSFESGICQYCYIKDKNYTDFNTDTIVLNEGKKATLKKNESIFYSFTPEKDGYYEVADYHNTSVSVMLYEDGKRISALDSSYKVACLYANHEYEFRVFNRLYDCTMTTTLIEHSHDIRIKTSQDMTCKNDGYAEFCCSKCSYTYREDYPMDPNEHHYVNGACNACGKVDESYDEAEHIHEIELDKEYTFDSVYGRETEKFNYTVEKDNIYELVLKPKDGSSECNLSRIKIYINGKKDRDAVGSIVVKTIPYASYNLKKGDIITVETDGNKGYSYTLLLQEHTHTLNASVVKPTCDALGYTIYRCSNSLCDYSYIDNLVEATGNHRFVTQTLAPTCTDFGVTVCYCTKCDAGYAYDYIAPDPLKHTYSYGVCVNCGKHKDTTATTTIPLNEQTNGSVPTKGTFVSFVPEEDGYYVIQSYTDKSIDTYCELYDENMYYIDEEDDISSSNYNFKLIVKLEGNKTYNLFIGSYESKAITAPIKIYKHQHTFNKRTASATCGKKGYVKYCCSCGECYYETVIPATEAHSWKTQDVVKPTCKDDGYTIQICNACKEEREIDIIKATGIHSYVNGICEYCEEIEPISTIFDSGISIGDNEVQITEKNQVAMLKFVPQQNGTYIFETNGVYDTYGIIYDSDNCVLLEDDDSGLGNNYKLIYDLAAGETYYISLRVLDREKADVTLSVSEHTHVYAQLVVTPTCGTIGQTIYTCKTCFSSYSTDYVPATYEHDFYDGVCNICGELDPDYKYQELNQNGNTTVTGEAVLTFVPKYNCEYTIKSNGNYEVSAALFNEFANDLTDIDFADSNNKDDFNFIIKKKLVAGVKYYLVVSATNSGEFTITTSVNHKLDKRTVNPTCSKDGYKEQYCTTCGYVNPKKDIIPKTNHNYATSKVTKPAKLNADGERTYYCSKCNATKKQVIKAVKSVTLSTTSYTYDKKTKTPSVTVKNTNGTTLKKDKDYKVTYASGRKYVGRYWVKITFMGNYGGSVTKTFDIKPKGTTPTKLTSLSKSIKVYWNKQESHSPGYQIQYATDSKFTKDVKYVNIGNYKTTSTTLKKLKGRTRYYVRIRTYKDVKYNGQNVRHYSSWSKVMYITTKR